MAVPRSKAARRFYRAGQIRREEPGALHAAGDATGTIYFGGYAVECTLKTLLLDVTPRAGREEVLRLFCGAAGRDLRGLRARYAKAAGGAIPADISLALIDLSRWTTDLRYSPKATPDATARDFLATTDRMGGMGSSGRLNFVWEYLAPLPLPELNEIGLVEPVTPAEVAESPFTPDFAALAA